MCRISRFDSINVSLFIENIAKTFDFVPRKRAFRKQSRQVAVPEKLLLFVKYQVDILPDNITQFHILKQRIPPCIIVTDMCFISANVNSVNDILPAVIINGLSDK